MLFGKGKKNPAAELEQDAYNLTHTGTPVYH